MKIFKGWSRYEIVWLTVFSSISIILSILWKDTIFGFTIFFSGVLNVILAAKGSYWNYSFGIYNSLTYSWLSYQNGLFGEVMLNMFFGVPINIIGWIMWGRKLDDNKTVIMRRMSIKIFMLTVGLCAISTVFYGYWLSTLKGQNTPYIDALITTTTIVGTFIMIFRFREQWIYYISVNALSIVMWIYRLAVGKEDAATMIVMWAAYLVNAIYGLYVWNKGSKKTAQSENQAIEAAV